MRKSKSSRRLLIIAAAVVAAFAFSMVAFLLKGDKTEDSVPAADTVAVRSSVPTVRLLMSRLSVLSERVCLIRKLMCVAENTSQSVSEQQGLRLWNSVQCSGLTTERS